MEITLTKFIYLSKAVTSAVKQHGEYPHLDGAKNEIMLDNKNKTISHKPQLLLLGTRTENNRGIVKMMTGIL